MKITSVLEVWEGCNPNNIFSCFKTIGLIVISMTKRVGGGQKLSILSHGNFAVTLLLNGPLTRIKF